jgi:hypothetical protein
VTLPPAGWYDDPNDGSVLRWWDGYDWATPTQPKAPPVPSGWYEDPASPGTTRWWDGSEWGDPPTDGEPASASSTIDLSDNETSLVAAGTVATILPAASDTDAAAGRGSDAPAVPAIVSYPPLADDIAVVAPQPHPGTIGSTAVAASSVVAAEAVLGDEEVAASTDASRPSRRRWVAVGIAVLVLALIAGVAWLVHGRMQESHLADPPSTAAEKNWGIAGDSLGTTLAARGITKAQLSTVCAGGFQDLWDSPLPTAVQGVDENRARRIYVDACTAGFDHPVGLSSPSPGAPTKPSTGASAKATSSPAS